MNINFENMNDVLRKICEISERLNELSIAIRDQFGTKNAKTKTELRYLKSGWKFQKWTEMNLGKDDLSACWYFQLSEAENSWEIEATLELVHGDFIEEMPNLYSSNIESLVENMNSTIKWLFNSLEQGHCFRNQVETYCS